MKLVKYTYMLHETVHNLVSKAYHLGMTHIHTTFHEYPIVHIPFGMHMLVIKISHAFHMDSTCILPAYGTNTKF